MRVYINTVSNAIIKVDCKEKIASVYASLIRYMHDDVSDSAEIDVGEVTSKVLVDLFPDYHPQWRQLTDVEISYTHEKLKDRVELEGHFADALQRSLLCSYPR